MSAGFNIRRNVITSMIAFASNLALVFISYRMVVSDGGLVALGLWSTLNSWIYIIRLGDVGMASATLRFIARCDAQTEAPRVRSYLDTAIAMNAALFVALALIGYAIYADNIDHIVPADETARATAVTILPLMFSGFVISNLSGLVLGGLSGLHRGYQSALITIAGALTQLVIVVIMVPRLGLAGLAWGQIGQHFVMLTVGWGMTLRAIKTLSGDHGGLFPRHISRPALREMLGFSLRAQAVNIINGLFEPLSKILIGRIGGLELLGQYEMAYKMVSLPRNAVVSGVQATAPAMTRLIAEDKPAARDLYARSRRTLIRKGSLVLLGTVLFAPVASLLWLDEIDYQLWGFIAVLAIGFLINTLGAPAYVLGLASGSLRGNIIASGASIALLFALAPLIVMAGGTPTATIAAISFAIAMGGLIVQRLNKSLLSDPPAKDLAK